MPSWFVYEADNDCLYAFFTENKAFKRAGDLMEIRKKRHEESESDIQILVFEATNVQTVSTETISRVKVTRGKASEEYIYDTVENERSTY